MELSTSALEICTITPSNVSIRTLDKVICLIIPFFPLIFTTSPTSAGLIIISTIPDTILEKIPLEAKAKAVLIAPVRIAE